MRPAVRYQARRQAPLTLGDTLEFDTVEGLLKDYKLLDIDILVASSADESEAIGALGDAHGYEQELLRYHRTDGASPGQWPVPGRRGRGPINRGRRGIPQHQLRQPDGLPSPHRHQRPSLPVATRRR